MAEDNIIQLTNAAYKVIEFFPEADPLKPRAKDRTLAIMENVTVLAGTDGWASLQRDALKRQVLEDIDVLLGYFWLAKAQGWLNSTNCLIISSQYEAMKKEIGPYMETTRKIPFPVTGVLSETKQTSPVSSEVFLIEKNSEDAVKLSAPKQKIYASLSGRQQNIIAFLKSNQKAQVMDLQKVLPGVTKRTIRRDLDDLLKKGEIVREGEYNSVLYRLGQNRT